MAAHMTPLRPGSHSPFPLHVPRKRSAPGNTASSASSSLACKKCRARKVKCDTAFPECSGCVKAGEPCIVADYTTSRDYTRSEVNDLEERLRQLEATLGQPDGATSESATRRRRRPANLTRRNETTENGPSPARYVGREAGVDFFQPMLEAIRKQSPASLSHGGMSASQVQASSIVYHEPHELPAQEEALRLAASYLTEFHVAHQFLDAAEIASLFARVWADVSSTSAAGIRKERRQDLFTVNMIMAIGSVGMFRSGLATLHPFGFFTAALLASPPSEFSFGTIHDIENLLLIAYFGIFYNIGCSIWELSRLCIRICVELQLYKEHAEGDRISDEEFNRRRRVFWEVYSLDRFASVTLGRPFAIEDAMITTIKAQRPQRTPDVDPLHESLDFIQAGWPSCAEANDRRVSDHLLALARITSSLHRSQQTSGSRAREPDTPNMPRGPSTTIHSGYRLLFKLKDDLDLWRNASPTFDQPGCLYQCPEYFDLCFQKEKLYLIRVAIDRNPGRGALPPQYLLTPCLDTAHNVIRLFDSLRQRNLATCTRSNTHLIFTTSLIILFLTFAQVHPKYRRPDPELRSTSRVDVGSWWAGLLEEGKAPTQMESLEVLAMAGATLEWLANNMRDMSPYAQFLNILRQELSKEIYKSSSSGTAANDTSAQPESVLEPVATDCQPEHSTDAFYDNMTDQVFPDVSLDANIPGQFEGHGAFAVPPQGQGISPEGFLFDLFPVEDFIQDENGMQPMMASWPFSQMPWMESFNTELSGYDADFFQFP